MTRYDILTAIPTAFGRDGTLDLEGSRAIFRYVAASGNEGAFVLGTTGEFPRSTSRSSRISSQRRSTNSPTGCG